MMNKKFPCVIKLFIALALLIGGPATALGEEFYRGKSILFIVGHAPGGGFDRYTRAVARHIGKYGLVRRNREVTVRTVLFLALLFPSAVWSLGCTGYEDRTKKESGVIVFRSADGRTLTLEELKGATGTFRYEIVGAADVPAEASALHQRARQAGGRGEYEQAITLLDNASELAPQWPYPVYDRAYTHLLMKDFDAARADYQKTVALAPRGFFTAITALDILTREQTGEFPRGTYLAYLSLEWVDDRAKKIDTVRHLVNRLPRFAPGWADLASFADQDSERLTAIEKGLAAEPDAETRGMLEINRALVLDRQGDHDGAVRLLGELALDPKSTYGTEQLARATLALVAKK